MTITILIGDVRDRLRELPTLAADHTIIGAVIRWLRDQERSLSNGAEKERAS